MAGASVSRWTMAYFAASLLFLLAGLGSMASGFGLVTAGVDAPETLAVVHMVAIGWLGLLFCGALLQFVPVLTVTHLRLAWVAAPALVIIVCGLIVLLSGFLALGGQLDVDPRLLSIGGAVLAVGFALVAAALVGTLLSQTALDVSGMLVIIGLVSLLVTVASGNAFAALLSGVIEAETLASRLQALVPYHAAAGSLGWMTLTAIGVSYRLFAMFMLAPERAAAKPVATMAASAIVVLLAAFGLSATSVAGQSLARAVCLACAASQVVLYVHDVLRMLKARRRKGLELNLLAGLVALAFLPVGLALLLCSQWLGKALPFGTAAFYVLAIGWLSGLGLAQLYKIIPFLTWIETYGPVMGRNAVPRVQDLVRERRAAVWFLMFNAAVVLGAAAILADSGIALRVASLCQCLAVAALSIEYLRARRLTYAPEPLKLPPGTERPHLIYATIKE